MGRRDRSVTGRSRALGRPPVWWRGSRAQMARWLLAVVLALGAATLVAGQVRHASDIVAGLGALRVVVVARHDIEPGRTVTADDLTTRQLPVLALAPGASGPEVIGRVVTARIVEGEVVDRARLAPAGISGIAALIPPGWRGVPVPRPSDGSGLTVHVGDVVDVLTADPGGLDRAESASVVAAGATVIGVEDTSVTLAVRPADAPGIATALGRGIPVLALVGPNATP